MGMRRLMATAAIVLAACGGGGPSQEDIEFDDSRTALINEETSCEDLAADIASRSEDLASQEADPSFGMDDYQVGLMEERVEVGEARMAELDC